MCTYKYKYIYKFFFFFLPVTSRFKTRSEIKQPEEGSIAVELYILTRTSSFNYYYDIVYIILIKTFRARMGVGGGQLSRFDFFLSGKGFY